MLNHEHNHINKVIKYFVLADLALFSGWGLVSPIFAVFVTEEIVEATLVTVGIGASIYWFVKSTVQLPVSIWVDKFVSEKIPLYVTILGLVLVSSAAFMLMFIDTIFYFYLSQFIHAIGMGIYLVAWRGIYSHHLDKSRVAFEWALNSSVIGYAAGVTGLLSGFVASTFGFDAVFLGAGILSIVSAIIIFLVPDLITAPKKQ